MRDKIGGYPFEVSKEGGKTVLKFFHKGENVKHPDAVKMTLHLSKEDIKKISKDFLNKNKEKYKEAFKAKAVMAFQKVDRYPAVVFNDKYVVYGTSDYEVAKDRYYAYKG